MSFPETAQRVCASSTGRIPGSRPRAGAGGLGVLLLALLALTGCIHDKNQAVSQPALAPPIEDTPLPKPDTAPANLPPPVISVPNSTPAPAASTPAQAETPPKPAVHHRKPANTHTETASNGSPGVSAIGQLSSGGAPDLRAQTRESIGATERGLNGLGRNLNGQERKTAAQIREYLKQAREALLNGDVDGARTLAAKAKVLLGELTR